MASAPRLAARCPACHTAFRVVADQLRLRGGLVRCGRCNHVFDGRAHLIELDAPPDEGAAQTAAPQPPGSHVPASTAAPAASEPHPAEPTPADDGDHGFGITLTWEEDIAEVHLGEVEGAETGPGTQPAAPDTRPPTAPPAQAEPEPPKAGPDTPAEAEPVAAQPETPAEAPAPADPFHGLPPLLDLDDDDSFAAAVPVRPSAEPAVAPVAAPPSRPEPPTGTTEANAPAEKHDSTWLRREADPHTLFAPVPRRQGRRAQEAHAEPVPQRTVTGAPRPHKMRGPNHGVSAATLDFLRAAQAREQQRKSSGLRAMARVAIGLLAVTAVAQLLFLGRTEIATRVPATRALWERLCQPLHCDVPPPRDLDALQIESSQMLRQEGDASDQYVLTATLRNRSDGPVALPAIELVTTDLQDQLLARRALLPTDYLSPADAAYGKTGLAARAELPIRVRFQSQRPTANYRVLIFYP
ncbi:DUF3426 domain-containing protein [Ralstonia syzygii subsp. celebesensis]|uniref:DUF3426 domain-containing protein n=3 Tax=Ralstonia solanacearum species complex TaxID=3116862 RepID=A0AAD0WG63_RALSL|nr:MULTISPECIES: DUF3426 domain-containing protein [Ralstonia solanacearum species complex]CCA81531.1 conserved hypothetical protein [blood disease bacterium R229]AQW30885.1 hypothetical protein B0B51_13590 [blood disease bacterium A2-HR MARDI]AXV80597.1 DUF3426 domain-containing protein [Ralstonia solanacearum]AXW51744.1 DUF3426 domain-containing protein [Ralstonia solanacearum]CBJ50083.1 conserved protein of unknown function [Ralstonia solanacearum PSI07]